MPCEINTVLKLSPAQGYPDSLVLNAHHKAQKDGYRLFALDVPVALVNESWMAYADVVIEKLVWHNQTTYLDYKIARLYDAPFALR